MFRADFDGLKMREDNPDLPYRSQTEYHHGCGHDGHTACLISAGLYFLSNIKKIPY